MAVHLVYYNSAGGTEGKHVFQFDVPTVLDWFRDRWRPEQTGLAITELDALLRHLAGATAPPVTERDLSASLARLPDHVLLLSHTAGRVDLQFRSVDSLLHIAVFDDQFVDSTGGDDTSFLLHEEWLLPTDVVPVEQTEGGTPDGAGECYLLFLRNDIRLDGNVDTGEFCCIKGVRLPDLARHLASAQPATWPFELWLLRSQLLADEDAPTAEERAFLAELRERPREEAGWLMYADWLTERGDPTSRCLLLRRALERVGRLPIRDLAGVASRRGFYAQSVAACRRELEEYVFERARHRRQGVPSLSASSVSDHIAQLALHFDHLESPPRDIFHQWYLFDDRWAAAHPRLARSLLWYAGRREVWIVGAPPL
jgi:uncharacterized protein (TIGR02996 family)